MKLAIALSILLSSAEAFVAPARPTNKPITALEATSNNNWVAAASAAVAGMTVASQAASASFTTLEQKATMLPAHVLVSKAPADEVVVPSEWVDDGSMPVTSEFKIPNKVLDAIGSLSMPGMPGGDNNNAVEDTKSVASVGAYHPEKGYESLDMSMPEYKIKDTDKAFDKIANNNKKFVASFGAYHPEKGYESLDMSMPEYKIKDTDKAFDKIANNNKKFVASFGAYHPEKGYESLDMSMPEYKIKDMDKAFDKIASNNKKFVASFGAYHPEKGYKSLDMSMPEYKIENSKLPNKLMDGLTMPGNKHSGAAQA